MKKYKINAFRAFSTVVNNLLIDYNLVPSVIIQGTGINVSAVMKYYKVLNLDSTYNIAMCNNYSSIKLSIEINKCFVYILKCRDGSYYTGYTSDIQKRLQQHQNGTGCIYTKTIEVETTKMAIRILKLKLILKSYSLTRYFFNCISIIGKITIKNKVPIILVLINRIVKT